MRPLKLELTAFRSYDAQVVDWRPYDLVVIAGDTGAGKSTLLDAICFALYAAPPNQQVDGSAGPGPRPRRGAPHHRPRRR